MSSNLDTLFVPIEVDALVINGQGKPMATNFNLNTRTYGNLRDFTTPEPDPFSANLGNNGQPEKGIHLHWALPAGLRHGYETEPDNRDSIRFPYLPNRWLLVRVTTTETNESSVKGWVLANDQWVDADTPNSTPYIDGDGSKIFLSWVPLAKNIIYFANQPAECGMEGKLLLLSTNILNITDIHKLMPFLLLKSPLVT